MYDWAGYVSSKLDKDGRAVMYLKVGRNTGKEPADAHQKFLMYTVERYLGLFSFIFLSNDSVVPYFFSTEIIYRVLSSSRFSD